MRDLTPEECEFIAGSGTVWGGTPEVPPQIVVVASPPPYEIVVVASPPPYYPPFEAPQPPAPTPGQGGTGGTGGGSSSDVYPASWDHQRDYNIDHVASLMIAKIQQKSDSGKIEYSGFIYKTSDGKFHESTIVQGNMYNTGQQNIASYNIPAGGQIVANIHNHPAEYWTGSNWVPNPNSVNVDYGDMAAMRDYAHQSLESQYRSYVYHNYNGATSELDYSQNQTASAGAPTAVDPNVVKGSYHPELGS